MKAQATFKGVHWLMVAIFVMTPASVFAQQATVPQQSETAQAKAPATQKQTEAAQPATVETPAPTEVAKTTPEKDKVISGMSVLGNQDAPKSLVIVPWKSSEIGKSLDISTMLDDSRQPIDKEVFMRVLSYYETRSSSTRNDGAPARSDASSAATAAQRRKQ
jgi:hypothetical protein